MDYISDGVIYPKLSFYSEIQLLGRVLGPITIIGNNPSDNDIIGVYSVITTDRKDSQTYKRYSRLKILKLFYVVLNTKVFKSC